MKLHIIFKNLFVIIIFLLSINLITAYIPDSSLKAFYRFEEGSGIIANDSSIYNHNGTINDCNYVNSYGSRGTGNYSLNFDGVNDFVALSIIDKPITISFWFNYDTIGGSEGLFQYGGNSGDFKTFTILFDVSGGNKLLLLTRTSSANYRYYLIANEVNISSGWNYLVVMWEETTKIAYLNGIQLALPISYEGGSNTNSYDLLDTDLTFIGKQEQTGFYYYDGQIDEVAIFDTFLNSSEVLDIYNNGINVTGVEENETIPIPPTPTGLTTYENLTLQEQRQTNDYFFMIIIIILLLALFIIGEVIQLIPVSILAGTGFLIYSLMNYITFPFWLFLTLLLFGLMIIVISIIQYLSN